MLGAIFTNEPFPILITRIFTNQTRNNSEVITIRRRTMDAGLRENFISEYCEENITNSAASLSNEGLSFYH